MNIFVVLYCLFANYVDMVTYETFSEMYCCEVICSFIRTWARSKFGPVCWGSIPFKHPQKQGEKCKKKKKKQHTSTLISSVMGITVKGQWCLYFLDKCSIISSHVLYEGVLETYFILVGLLDDIVLLKKTKQKHHYKNNRSWQNDKEMAV